MSASTLIEGRLRAPFFPPETAGTRDKGFATKFRPVAGVAGHIAFDSKGDIKNGALTRNTYKGDKREQMAVVR